ncbi:hypothetical protein P3T37_006070 [Kitasatospora sp. MAA4]|uniref:hypothetical protein n=1 Tax=Kitasatospora sp. MAA4 TaxID=3035093 RepID=UPI002476B399|nr:hypothetical protein [Kitasatospora sp. MAA4]MDH6136639.1 hypothetical protein [Kitasatospora sp. MAA4]
METITAGVTGQAWSEFVAGRPAVLYPKAAAPDTGGLLTDGWSQQNDFQSWARPNPDWTAVLDEHRLRVTRLGELRFEGELPVSWEWRRAARTHLAALNTTGAFTCPAEFRTAVRTRALFLLVTPLRLTGCPTGAWRRQKNGTTVAAARPLEGFSVQRA